MDNSLPFKTLSGYNQDRISCEEQISGTLLKEQETVIRRLQEQEVSAAVKVVKGARRVGRRVRGEMKRSRSRHRVTAGVINRAIKQVNWSMEC